MPRREAIDPARRRLAALLLGTPLAGALQAAPDPSPNPGAPPAAPADAPAGGDFTGRWAHAYPPYGAPKYGPAFTPFDHGQPRGPRGGTVGLATPHPRPQVEQ